LYKVETRVRDDVLLIESFMHDSGTDDYACGFLAGFFDAEGSFDGHNVRVSQKDTTVLDYIVSLGKRLDQEWQIEHYKGATGVPTARLVGGLPVKISFFTRCRPRIQRKMSNLFGIQLYGFTHTPVVSAEPAGVQEVVDIQTSTHTFFAEGLATHNCFMKDHCPGFRPHNECLYEFPVEVTTITQTAAVMDGLIKMQTQRVLRMQLFEQVMGGDIDPNLSNEMDRLTKMIKQKFEANREGIDIHIRGSRPASGMGPISQHMGADMANRMNPRAENTTPEQMAIDAGIIQGRVEE
jgi:hypothetical protein